MRRIAAGLVVMFMSVLGVVALGVTPAHADTIDSTAEAQFVTLINALRASKGLGTLTVDANLTSVARNWSQQMANAGTISHNPNFPNQVTSDWQMLGENVGQGYSVQSLFDAFVASPHHYENLVEPSFTRVGVGVIVTASGQIFTSHQFMSLRSGGGSAPAPAATTTKATTPRASTPRTTAAPRVTTPRPATTSAPRPTTPTTAAPAPAPAPAAASNAAPPTPPARFVLALQQLESFDPSN
ncbi:MAG: CAP domain-containing protein [Actinobacteria bacterium]|nr:CAP domain-containing protein [Actinomycetota bacterium]